MLLTFIVENSLLFMLNSKTKSLLNIILGNFKKNTIIK